MIASKICVVKYPEICRVFLSREMICTQKVDQNHKITI